jgi:hypothetical protein
MSLHERYKNMQPELIVMLTHHDQTVPQAHALFAAAQDLPVRCWGFKDVGLPVPEMQSLVRAMKAASKTTFLEVVSLSEADGLRGAQVALDGGFDILMGTVYFPSIQALLRGTAVQYYPFPGHVHSHPSILDGEIDEIVTHARWLEAQGVQGLDLLAYRYTGDAFRLLKEVVLAVEVPVVSAGSIASFARIAEVQEAGAWGFTIGSAFFEGAFVPGGSFGDNIKPVCQWLEGTRA